MGKQLKKGKSLGCSRYSCFLLRRLINQLIKLETCNILIALVIFIIFNANVSYYLSLHTRGILNLKLCF